MERVIPRSEAIRRDLALQELEEAMKVKDAKYVKSLVPFLRPQSKEYDSNSSQLDDAESQTSFNSDKEREQKDFSWNNCFCCCNNR